jgi:hypothetical protein
MIIGLGKCTWWRACFLDRVLPSKRHELLTINYAYIHPITTTSLYSRHETRKCLPYQQPVIICISRFKPPLMTSPHLQKPSELSKAGQGTKKRNNGPISPCYLFRRQRLIEKSLIEARFCHHLQIQILSRSFCKKCHYHRTQHQAEKKTCIIAS